MNRFLMRLVVAILTVSVLATSVFASGHHGHSGGHSSHHGGGHPSHHQTPHSPQHHGAPAHHPGNGHSGMPKPKTPARSHEPHSPTAKKAHNPKRPTGLKSGHKPKNPGRVPPGPGARNARNGGRSGRTDRKRVDRSWAVVQPGCLLVGSSGIVVDGSDGGDGDSQTDSTSQYGSASTPGGASASRGAGIVAMAQPADEDSDDESPALRFVDVRNDTRESVTFCVQYCTLDDNGQWVWQCTEQPLKVEVKAGETKSVRNRIGERIEASCIRIWAESASGLKWEQFKDADLMVVGEDVPDDSPTFVFTVASAKK
jgi:hypothetical protein